MIGALYAVVNELAAGERAAERELAETDFRGERFADHATDLKGNNDILCLTRPDVIADVQDTIGVIFQTAQGPYEMGEITAEGLNTDPITEEITCFNSEGIADNVVLRDPGGTGFFIFND